MDIVTVVTLTYKRFDYIYSVIDSVLSQDYPAIEYIISDDGSDNFSKKEIIDYISKNKKQNIVSLSVLHHNKNVGTVRNINQAYRKAKGKILIPLSGDDVFYNNHVISDVIREFDTSDSNVVVVRRCECDLNDNVVRFVPTDKELKYVKKLNTSLKQYKAFVTDKYYEAGSGSVMYLRKTFFDEWGGFDEKYTLWEDGPFLTQFTWNNRIHFALDIIGIKHHEGGVSSGQKHPLLLRDAELYNETDKIAHIDELDFITRSTINFSLDRIKIRDSGGGIFDTLRCYISHPVGFLSIANYRIKRKVAGNDR